MDRSEFEDYYGKNPSYSSTTKAAPKEVHQFFRRLREECGPSSVLDVGCGTGEDAVVAEKFGHTVIGVDLTDDILEKFKHGPPTRSAVEGDICSLSNNEDLKELTPPEGFSAVFCGFVLIHLPMDDGRAAIGELAKVLAPDKGRIFLATHVHNERGTRMFKHVHAGNEGLSLSPISFYSWAVDDLKEAFSRTFISPHYYELKRFFNDKNEYYSLILEGTAPPDS